MTDLTRNAVHRIGEVLIPALVFDQWSEAVDKWNASSGGNVFKARSQVFNLIV